MPWPLASHFSTIVQNPRVAFRDPQLQGCTIERNALHQPRVWSGQFAVVYKGTDPAGKTWALRAFTTESRDRREHYDCISEHLRARKLRCLVDFEYRDAAIRSAGDGKWYPLITMDWVEGLTLFAWIGTKCRAGKGPSLEKAVRHWLNAVNELSEAGIAHGDLQHANVLVTPQGRLKLVDYDGLCVPALFGRRNREIGIPPYQHPERNETTLLSPQLDNFSALVIYVALRALAADTTLWARYVEQPGYDKLLFRSEDFREPDESPLVRELLASPDRGVRKVAKQLFAFAVGRLDAVPPLVPLVAALPPMPSAPLTAADRGQAARFVPQGVLPHATPKLDEVPRRTASATRVVLELISGPEIGTTFVMDREQTVLVGRGTDCQVRISDDRRVSRHHCQVDVAPPHARLRDLGSRNGTYVNETHYSARAAADPANATAGATAAEVSLQHGDRIKVGHTVIEIRVVN